MERPPETLKSFSNRLAELASGKDSTEVIRLLRLAGLLGESDKSAGHSTHSDNMFGPPPNPDHVGIWERKIENGKVCFVRRLETMAEWDLWNPNLGRIEAKSSKKRIVYIGESVARGYLYDPEFTPAMALEMILKPHFAEGIEVIDLARSNLSHEIKHLAISALQLEPDIGIMFGGNNWGVAFPGTSDIAQLDEALMREGMPGAKPVCNAQIARVASRIVNEIAAAYESKGVPLIWIVPEFNLGDWRDPLTNPPHLGKGLNREWLKVLEEAQSALRDGDLGRAKELANRLIEIDQGICQAGIYILAECCRRVNDIEGERKYLEMARDALSWDSSRLILPRTYAITQQSIREEARKHNNQVVDSPALFKEYLKGEIPGRRMFLDYCHLTTEGIQVTMAATASCVLQALKGKEVPWFTLVKEDVAPPVKTEAEASFLAAIMNAHWWQSYDLTRHYCKRALSLSRHIADVMLLYIDLQTRRTPPKTMGEAERQINSTASHLMRHYLLNLNEKRLDKVLLGAIVDTLDEFGIDGRELLERLRREHSVAFEETDLFDYYYCSSADQPQELAWMMRIVYKTYKPQFEPKYYRAFGSESRFIFVGTADVPVRLSLTCRLPNTATGESKISVALNGVSQAEMTISRQWSTWEINVAGDVVREGLNEVSVHWPVPEFESSSEALDKVVMNLFNFWELKFPNFFPLFGEIHSFKASGAPVISTTVPMEQPEFATVEVS
jgi:hypothetical protein